MNRVATVVFREPHDCVATLLLIASLLSGVAADPPLDAGASTGDPQIAIVTLHDDLIDDVTASSFKRRAEEAVAQGATVLVVELDTPGGMVSSAVNIAKTIRDLSENRGIKVVAWIRNEAISGGTLISMACDEIIMSRAATLGDCGVIMVGPGGGASTTSDPALDAKIESYVMAVFDSAAARNGYDPLLCDSFVRHEVEVWWVEHGPGGERRFVSTEQKDKLLSGSEDSTWRGAARTDATGWQLVKTYVDPRDDQEKPLRQPIVPSDKLLTIDQSMAQVLGFSKAMIRDEAELRQRYGMSVTQAVPRLDQTWSEELVSWLTSPLVRMFLIAVIGMGAYVEFQSPGVGLPGMAALLALIVFLGAPYLTGLANVWEVAVILLGVALILLEVFVIPGFGLAGVSGLVLLLVGLLATFMPEEPGRLPIYWPELPQSFEGLKTGVLTLAGGMTAMLAGMVMLSKYMYQIPYLRMVAPANPTAKAVMPDDAYNGLARVADVGRCVGPLRPSGKARFGPHLVDVVSEGDMLDDGTEVEVIERRGNRVVVRRVG